MTEYCYGNATQTGSDNWTANFIACMSAYTPTGGLKFSKVMAFINPNGVQKIKCALYKASDLTLVAVTEEVVHPANGANWYEFPAVGEYFFTGEALRIAIWSDSTLVLYRRALTNGSGYKNVTYNSFPSSLTLTSYNYQQCLKFCGVEVPAVEIPTVSTQDATNIERY